MSGWPRGRRILASTIAVAVGALAAVGPPAGATTRTGPEAVASIVGGRPASIAEFPWLSFIEGRDLRGRYACSGTVVAPRVVLTAGHCVEDPELRASPRASDVRVRTGAADRRKAIPSTVSRVVVNPGYDTATSQGDAGLLILSAPVAAPALPLASDSDSRLLAAGTPISIAGWGLTEGDSLGDPPNALRWGPTAIQPTRYCKGRSAEFEVIYSPSREFCAGEPSGIDANICFGDSGGPAIAKREDGSPVEVGITSLGNAFCATNLPGIYTRVDRISPWVAGWIASVEAGGPPPGPTPDRPPGCRRRSPKRPPSIS